MANWQPPTDVAGVRAFLDFVGYYRRFVPDFSTVAKPLNQLTSSKCLFVWGKEQDAAFATLKQAMLTARSWLTQIPTHSLL